MTRGKGQDWSYRRLQCWVDNYNVGAKHWQDIWITKNHDVKVANKHDDANDTQKTPFWRVEKYSTFTYSISKVDGEPLTHFV
jgi:hypothetical protein